MTLLLVLYVFKEYTTQTLSIRGRVRLQHKSSSMLSTCIKIFLVFLPFRIVDAFLTMNKTKKNKAYTSIPQLRYVHIFKRLASLKEARANCTADIKY